MATRIAASQRTREELRSLIEVSAVHGFGQG